MKLIMQVDEKYRNFPPPREGPFKIVTYPRTLNWPLADDFQNESFTKMVGAGHLNGFEELQYHFTVDITDKIFVTRDDIFTMTIKIPRAKVDKLRSIEFPFAVLNPAIILRNKKGVDKIISEYEGYCSSIEFETPYPIFYPYIDVCIRYTLDFNTFRAHNQSAVESAHIFCKPSFHVSSVINRERERLKSSFQDNVKYEAAIIIKTLDVTNTFRLPVKFDFDEIVRME